MALHIMWGPNSVTIAQLCPISNCNNSTIVSHIYLLSAHTFQFCVCKLFWLFNLFILTYESLLNTMLCFSWSIPTLNSLLHLDCTSVSSNYVLQWAINCINYYMHICFLVVLYQQYSTMSEKTKLCSILFLSL